MLLMDKLLIDEMSTFRSHYTIPDMSKPFSISGNLTLLSSVTSIVSNYLDNTSEDKSKDEVYSSLPLVDIQTV